ncbi:MAG: hypothetical protein H6Q73_860 [Firmicutes bacterium]|nr:hypothetical protein [Bacillota bacterium]
MTKLRLEITKGEEIRYISHLDYARTMERALRRSKMPVAYSEGFNPHMKMSFASALSVGVTSEAEYMEVELSKPVSAEKVFAALAHQLPPTIAIKRVKEVVGKQKALMAMVNLAVYKIVMPWHGDQMEYVAKDAVSRFNRTETVLYVKENPKGNREIDIKKYIAEAVEVVVGPKGAELSMVVWITPQGSVKPSEVLKVLVEDFAFPGSFEAALIKRSGLYVQIDHERLSPMEM